MIFRITALSVQRAITAMVLYSPPLTVAMVYRTLRNVQLDTTVPRELDTPRSTPAHSVTTVTTQGYSLKWSVLRVYWDSSVIKVRFLNFWLKLNCIKFIREFIMKWFCSCRYYFWTFK